MQKTITIHVNGCTVTCPTEQEQLYREALADKWIDGCRIYVENGEVKTEYSKEINQSDEMDLDTSENLILEYINKLAALDGEL